MFMNPITLAAALAPLALTALAPLAAAKDERPKETPQIKPIESFWLLSIRRFPGTSDSDAALTKTLKQWRPTGVFNAVLLLCLPPTFADEKKFIPQANALMKDVGGQFIIATLPVGKEGWESSGNERFAKRQPGATYDPNKAMTQLQWLEKLKGLRADTWAWNLEQPARMPTDEAARAAGEFVRFAKAQRKRPSSGSRRKPSRTATKT